VERDLVSLLGDTMGRWLVLGEDSTGSPIRYEGRNPDWLWCGCG